jgi:hypothetical protein
MVAPLMSQDRIARASIGFIGEKQCEAALKYDQWNLDELI